MQGMLAIPLAVLHELKLLLHGFAVLLGRIVAALALTARHGDNLYNLLLASHTSILSNEIGTRLAPFGL
jgi:hypothetical protein